MHEKCRWLVDRADVSGGAIGRTTIHTCMNSCSGTTVKGERCKRRVRAGEVYCFQHGAIDELVNEVDKLSLRDGFLYVYALDGDHGNAHVYNHSREKFERLNKKRLFSRNKQFLLLKIGCTTRTPQTRVKEWTDKCRHPIHLIGPKYSAPKFDAKHVGWPTKSPQSAEKRAHQELFRQFGRGHVICHGCNEKHHEWFLVPDKSLDSVFSILLNSLID